MREAVGLVEEINLRVTLGPTDGLAENIGLGEAIRIEALGLVDGIDSELFAWTDIWTGRRNRFGRSHPN